MLPQIQYDKVLLGKMKSNYFNAKALYETIKANAEEIQRKVLAENEFYETEDIAKRMEKRGGDGKPKRILDPDLTYMMDLDNELRIYKEGGIMSQSNYEKYAVVKQQELLHKERNLQQAISCLRDRRKFASLQSIDSAIDFVADLYDLSIDEVKRVMDGEEYWCI